MKRFIRYIMALAVLVFAAGCVNEEKVMINPDDVIVPVLHDPGFSESITITPSNQAKEIVFTWDAAHVGFGAQLNYSVEIYLDENGKKVPLGGGVASTTTTVKYEDLNYSLVYSLGATPLEPVAVKFCLSASIGVRKFYSEPIVITVVPTNAAKQFPHIYFIGSYCGWNHKEAQLMYDYSENGINYQAVIDLGEDFMTTTAGGFKLTPEGNWNAEWAEPAAWTDEYKAQVAAGTLEKDLDEVEFATGGGDCLRYSESHRFYHFSLSTETNVFSMEAAFDAAKLVLDGEEVALNFHAAKHSQYFYADVVVKAGSKLRLVLLSSENGQMKEAMSFGGDDAGTEGIFVLAEDGATAKDINVAEEPGNYRIYVDMNNWDAVTYEFDYDMYGQEEGTGAVTESHKGWGICGYTNNWTGDIPMTFDETTRWWVAKNVHLDYDYEFNFRKDGAGAIVFKGGGFKKNEATFQSRGGDNIIVGETGYYDIYLDATNGCCWFCTPGQKPSHDASPVRPDDASDWAICGTMTEWGGAEGAEGTVADIWMKSTGVTIDGKVVQFYVAENVQLAAGDEFKFRHLYRWDSGEKTISTGVADPDFYYPLVDGKENGNIVAPDAGTYDVYVTTDMKYIYFMTAGTSPSEASYIYPEKPSNAADWSLTGTFVDWGDWWMVEEGDYYVAKGVKLSSTAKFKFRYKSAWDLNRGGTGPVEADCYYSLTQGGGDITIAEAGTYDIYLAKSLDRFYFMSPGKTPAEAADGTAGYSEWSVAGDFNGWGDTKMKEDGDYYVAKNITLAANSMFKFKKGNWVEEKYVASTVYPNKSYVVVNSGYDLNTVVGEAGTYDIYLSKSLNKMYFMTAGTPIEDAEDTGGSSSGGTTGTPSEWVIVGSFTDNWSGSISMEVIGDYIVAKNVNVPSDGEFKFRKGSSWDEVRTANTTVVVNTRYSVAHNADGNANTKVAAGTYDFYLSANLDHFYLMPVGEVPPASGGSESTTKTITIYGNTTHTNLYMWLQSDNNIHPAGDWPGKANEGSETVNGVTYKKWTVTVSATAFSSDKAYFIFNTPNGGQTNDSNAFSMTETMYLKVSGNKAVLAN